MQIDLNRYAMSHMQMCNVAHKQCIEQDMMHDDLTASHYIVLIFNCKQYSIALLLFQFYMLQLDLI